jgi:hypothetical protein
LSETASETCTFGAEPQPDPLIEEPLLPAPDPEGTVSALSISPCSDGAYNDSGQGWAKKLTYLISASTTPSGVSQADMIDRIRRAENTWTVQKNRCGFPELARQIEQGVVYGGTTGRFASINNSTECTGEDGYNVVHFGDLSAEFYGAACTYWDNVIGRNPMREGDIKMDGWTYQWTPTNLTTCNNKFGIWAGVAHEWGHVIGLNHPSTNDLDNEFLTMSRALQLCSFQERTLGKGDYDGFVHIY